MVLTALLLISSVAGCQQPPVPLPAPPPPFQVSATPEEAHYLPGEPVEVKFSITNVSSNPVTFDPYPPEIQVRSVSQDEVVFSIPAGTQPLEISPNDTITLEFSWDQKDKAGKQVPPGWYFDPFRGYGMNVPAWVLIQHPQGTMEKTIELNQSQTVKGIMVTLERIELTSSGMTVYAIGTLFGYPVPPGITNTANAMEHVSAEYSVDDGIVKKAGSVGMQYLENRTRFIWSRHVDPVPSDAKELIFRISTITLSFAPDKPIELVVGPWEFKIPLE